MQPIWNISKYLFQENPTNDISDLTTMTKSEPISTSGEFQLKSLTSSVKMATLNYMRTGAIEDIFKAVCHAQKALEVIPTNDPNKGGWLGDLGNLLAWRFERTGTLDDLQQAILRTEEALKATPTNHPNRTRQLINLGNWLGKRFEQIGNIDDLGRAIQLSLKAVQSTPQGHPYQASRLSSLANWLVRRHEQTGNLEDLERAIRYIREAIEISSHDHPNRISYRASLGNMLAVRYKQTADTRDIRLSIVYIKEAINSIPDGSPGRMSWLSNLGVVSAWKYEKTHDFVDLQYAISNAEEAVEAIPRDHPNRAASLSNLGDLLYARFDRNNSRGERDWLRRYKESFGCNNAPPSLRIRTAQKAAFILLGLEDVEESSILLTQAVNLLPTITVSDREPNDQRYMLREFSEIATLAAYAVLLRNTGKKGSVKALQLLELGRGIMAWLRFGFWTDLLAMNESNSDLTGYPKQFESHPGLPNLLQLTLVGRYGRITRQLSTNWQLFDTKLEENISQAQQRSNFNRTFLPTEDELETVASNGPVVVINVSPFRCHALLIEADTIRTVTLSKLHYQDLTKNVELLKSIQNSSLRSPQAKHDLTKILEWLWDTVAGPILEELGFQGPPTCGKWPHVWWIPTGLLSLLPLHAAGRHHPKSSETVIDRVVSSYSSSVKMLLYARQLTSLHKRPQNALLVSMQTTPGCSPLDNSGDEITAVEELARPLNFKTHVEKPCKENVINGLKHCDIFHFAGHSMLDANDPLQSRLLLWDWQEDPLTVKDIIGLKQHGNRPFLAYLSACSTGTNSARRLQDESINLMTACQLAGFRHAVGSMWDVYDIYSVDAAREFYKSLRDSTTIDDEAVAFGVHMAARHIRETTRNEELGDDEGDPLAWAAYIHMGP